MDRSVSRCLSIAGGKDRKIVLIVPAVEISIQLRFHLFASTHQLRETERIVHDIEGVYPIIALRYSMISEWWQTRQEIS